MGASVEDFCGFNGASSCTAILLATLIKRIGKPIAHYTFAPHAHWCGPWRRALCRARNFCGRCPCLIWLVGVICDGLLQRVPMSAGRVRRRGCGCVGRFGSKVISLVISDGKMDGEVVCRELLQANEKVEDWGLNHVTLIHPQRSLRKEIEAATLDS